ncbi:MAG: lasso RiPP family leader peptide-containing protein [Acidimicrobiales bacterium]
MTVSTYEAPQITEIGTLHELTLTIPKDFTGDDGFAINGQPIGPVS